MRLLLDVHLSDEKVGDPLRTKGHDVLAAENDDGLRRLDDEPLLEWALPQRRVVVTANVRDFLPIISRRLRQATCRLHTDTKQREEPPLRDPDFGRRGARRVGLTGGLGGRGRCGYLRSWAGLTPLVLGGSYLLAVTYNTTGLRVTV